MSKSASLGIIFLVEFGLGLWQFKPHGPTSTRSQKRTEQKEWGWREGQLGLGQFCLSLAKGVKMPIFSSIWRKIEFFVRLDGKCLEQPHQLMDSLLKYKNYSILHILMQKPPTLVFVKMSKYVQWSCK